MSSPSFTLPQPPPVPWTFRTSQGIHCGELIVATEWQPDFDGPLLDTRADFRLVILTNRGDTPPQPPANPRVLCFTLPEGRPSAPQDRQPTPSVSEAPVVYGTLAQIQQELGQSEPLRQFLAISRDYLETYCYVSQASLPESALELGLDRAALMEQLDSSYLVDHPEVWRGIVASFQWFRARYRTLYREYHQHYQEELARTRALLLKAGDEVEALRRLDSIPQVGPPCGEAAIQAWEAVLMSTGACTEPVQGEEFLLTQPWCTRCSLTLTTPFPRSHAESMVSQVEGALKTQCRRLSSETIRRVLATTNRPRLEQFLDVLQASDVASLVRVLDDELTEFLRSLLSEALEVPLSAKIVAPLREKFGAIEEAQIPAAVREFEKLLRRAVTEAKKQHPEGPVRLIVE